MSEINIENASVQSSLNRQVNTEKDVCDHLDHLSALFKSSGLQWNTSSSLPTTPSSPSGDKHSTYGKLLLGNKRLLAFADMQ